MKFTGVHLKNFGCHRNLSLNLNKITIVQAPNLYGKTMIANAIEWVLAGWTRRMARDNDRQGEKALINDSMGVDGMGVELRMEKYAIVKKRSKSGAPTILIDDIPKRQADIGKIFGMDNLQIKAALNSGYFLDLPSSDRKKLLFDLLGKRVNEKRLKEMLSTRGLDEEYIKKIVPQIIEAGYLKTKDFAVDKRRKVKRELNDLTSTEPEDSKTEFHGNIVPVSEIDLDDVIQGIDKLQEERDKILQEIGAGESQLVNQLDEAQNKEGELRRRKEVLQANSEELQKELAQIHYSESEHEKVEKEHVDLQGKSIRTVTELKLLQDRYKNLGEGNECPLCHSQVDVDSLKEKIQTKIVALIKRNENLGLEAAKVKLEEMGKLKGLYVDKQKLINSLSKDIENVESELSPIAHRALELKQKVDESNNTEVEILKTRKEKIEQNIKKGQMIQGQVENYQMNSDKWKKDSDIREELNMAIEQWDKVDKALAPDGIQKDLLNEAIKPLRKRLEKTSEKIFGAVHFDEELHFSIDGKDEFRFDPLGSEYLRLGYFIQEAIAHIGGLGLLIFDRVDCLDPDNRELFLGFVNNIKKDYDNIILLLTSTEKKSSEDKDVSIVDLKNI